MSKTHAAIVGVLGAALVATVTAQTQQRPARALTDRSALTAMDYVQIRQLVNRYAFALDTTADEGYEYADLFTTDGVFGDIQGREQLAAFARKNRGGPLYVSLYLMNHVIEPSPEGATGRQYVVQVDHDNNPNEPTPGVPGPGGDGRPFGKVGAMGGHYEDVYAKTAQGWRFNRRQFIPSASGPTPAQRGFLAPIGPVARVRPDPSDTVPATFGGLSAMDYLEIEQLIARYPHALDNGYGRADIGDSFAHIFTADGSFETCGLAPQILRFCSPGQGANRLPAFTGHDTLAAMARGGTSKGPAYIRHFLTNHVIEPWAGRAIGKQYLVRIDLPDRASGKPPIITQGAHYEDVYEKTAEGWRIRIRRLIGHQR
jgi:hypothetical protein